MSGYPYVWFWRQKPGFTSYGTPPRLSPPRMFDRERKDTACRVICRGRMNSALIEFEDGYRVVTTRNGLRRREGVNA